MNIYLDIDGVILANDKQKAIGAQELLLWLLVSDYYDVYWLSTHVKGSTGWVLNYLRDFFEPHILYRLRDIKPTNWKTAKTDGINFKRPFFWFDDELYPDERKELIRRDAIDCFIPINLSKDPKQLEAILHMLQQNTAD